eukprot:TRINITY_DN10474_c0_g1_i2.p1 TRINITY_DN10474_c0_g1~~TRINITY_DN10474_c0_g1_i2.p1  ORF type:complete len:670 (+),score=127.70 TRINITY_DN10474_c0_g1_i2:39-2012(+)
MAFRAKLDKYVRMVDVGMLTKGEVKRVLEEYKESEHELFVHLDELYPRYRGWGLMWDAVLGFVQYVGKGDPVKVAEDILKKPGNNEPTSPYGVYSAAAAALDAQHSTVYMSRREQIICVYLKHESSGSSALLSELTPLLAACKGAHHLASSTECATAKVNYSVDATTAWVENYYNQQCPEKLSSVPNIMKAFNSSELRESVKFALTMKYDQATYYRLTTWSPACGEAFDVRGPLYEFFEQRNKARISNLPKIIETYPDRSELFSKLTATYEKAFATAWAGKMATGNAMFPPWRHPEHPNRPPQVPPGVAAIPTPLPNPPWVSWAASNSLLSIEDTHGRLVWFHMHGNHLCVNFFSFINFLPSVEAVVTIGDQHTFASSLTPATFTVILRSSAGLGTFLTKHNVSHTLPVSPLQPPEPVRLTGQPEPGSDQALIDRVYKIYDHYNSSKPRHEIESLIGMYRKGKGIQQLIDDLVSKYGPEPCSPDPVLVARVMGIYAKYNPAKPKHEVDSLIAKYHASQGVLQLITDLVGKYGPEPGTVVAEEASESKPVAAQMPTPIVREGPSPEQERSAADLEKVGEQGNKDVKEEEVQAPAAAIVAEAAAVHEESDERLAAVSAEGQDEAAPEGPPVPPPTQPMDFAKLISWIEAPSKGSCTTKS